MANNLLVRVRVPASTSNVGPGYDVLGIALKLYNVIEVYSGSSCGCRCAKEFIRIEGEGADSLPGDASNIVWRAIMKAMKYSSGSPKSKGIHVGAQNLRVRMINRIPLARGLGSSAAAKLGGLLAGNELCGKPLTQEEILDIAAGMEGHPDNVTPSLYGGLCISMVNGKSVKFLKMDIPKDLACVVCVPDFELFTAKARSVLPEKVSHKDAAYNISRVSILIGALAKRDYSLLKYAMEDKLHQNYRKGLIPGFDDVLKNGYSAGALGIALSGAGPSVFAFVAKRKASGVGRAMEKGFAKRGRHSRSLILGFDSEGAKVERV